MKSSRVATPVVAAIAVCVAATLSGCSLFAPGTAPAGSTPVTVQEGGPAEPEDIVELRRMLYGLHAILVLHNAQEEEGVFSLLPDEPAKPERR